MTVEVTCGDLEKAHAAHLFVPEWMTWHEQHDGSAHCRCSIARALRDLTGSPQPGTPEYRKLYGVPAEYEGNKQDTRRARQPARRRRAGSQTPPSTARVEAEERLNEQ